MHFENYCSIVVLVYSTKQDWMWKIRQNINAIKRLGALTYIYFPILCIYKTFVIKLLMVKVYRIDTTLLWAAKCRTRTEFDVLRSFHFKKTADGSLFENRIRRVLVKIMQIVPSICASNKQSIKKRIHIFWSLRTQIGVYFWLIVWI